MARPIKQGLDYFPLDVDIFYDKNIRILMSKYGADGFTIYTYILCEIYNNGYYVVADKDFVCLMADDLGMKVNKINLVLKFLLERSLFDNTLFQSDTVLTSVSVQRRFQLAVKERAKKITIEVNGFWLLKREETETFIKVTHFLENQDEKSAKESKVKESRVEESKKRKTLLPEEMMSLVKSYGADVTKDYIERTTQYNCCNYDTIIKWIEEDKVKTRSKPQFTGRKYTDKEMKMLEQKLIENI